MPVLMFIMECLFLINTVVLSPITKAVEWITCGRAKLYCLTDSIDDSYHSAFMMQRLDAQGFRRMRTITQTTFESLIQIIL